MDTEEPKVRFSGTVESTPRLETLLRIAREIGPLEVEITKRDLQRLGQVPANQRSETLRGIVRAKALGEERASLEALVRKDRAEIDRFLENLQQEGRGEEADQLLESGATQRSYVLADPRE